MFDGIMNGFLGDVVKMCGQRIIINGNMPGAAETAGHIKDSRCGIGKLFQR